MGLLNHSQVIDWMQRPDIPARLVAAVIVVCIAFASVSAKADEASEAKAVAASKAWLALIDRGQYGEGWERAAAYMKAVVPRSDLVRALEGVRTPLGGVVARTLVSKQYATSLPGAPDGAYVVIQYDTVFENKQSAVETITPMRDPDGEWRVSGYYIR